MDKATYEQKKYEKVVLEKMMSEAVRDYLGLLLNFLKKEVTDNTTSTIVANAEFLKTLIRVTEELNLKLKSILSCRDLIDLYSQQIADYEKAENGNDENS